MEAGFVDFHAFQALSASKVDLVVKASDVSNEGIISTQRKYSHGLKVGMLKLPVEEAKMSGSETVVSMVAAARVLLAA